MSSIFAGHLPVRSVVEIGTGRVALVKRPSDLGFVEELGALQESPNGVQPNSKLDIARLEACTLSDG